MLPTGTRSSGYGIDDSASLFSLRSTRGTCRPCSNCSDNIVVTALLALAGALDAIGGRIGAEEDADASLT